MHVWPGEWSSFLQSFSDQHAGWLVRLEVIGPGCGAQVELEGLPLEAISVDHDRGLPAVCITAGDCSGGHLTHVVDKVRDVWVQTAIDGAEDALEINAPGARALLTLRAALS